MKWGERVLRVRSVSREEVWASAGVQGAWMGGCGCGCEADQGVFVFVESEALFVVVLTALSCSAEVIDNAKRYYSPEASLLVAVPLAPSGVAIDEQGSVEVRGRSIRWKALDATDLLSHLHVPFRLHCALFATKICVGGGLTRMRPPRLFQCAATPPPPHFLRQLTKLSPPGLNSAQLRSQWLLVATVRGEWQRKEGGFISQPRVQERAPRLNLPSKVPAGQRVLRHFCQVYWRWGRPLKKNRLLVHRKVTVAR